MQPVQEVSIQLRAATVRKSKGILPPAISFGRDGAFNIYESIDFCSKGLIMLGQ